MGQPDRREPGDPEGVAEGLDTDQATDQRHKGRRARLLEELGWTGPVYGISALTGSGTDDLMADLMKRLETLRLAERTEAETAAAEDDWHPLG